MKLAGHFRPLRTDGKFVEGLGAVAMYDDSP